jgi:LCP family protein required for cell wall assembly
MTISKAAWRRVFAVGWRTGVALLSASALALTAMAWSFQQRVENHIVTSDAISAVRPAAPPTVRGEAFTALLVGLDARTDAAGNPLPQAMLDAMHAGPDEGQLHTDTIIVLHVPAEPGAAPIAISIPRDSFVEISDGSGKHKINSAYGRALRTAEDKLTKQGVTGTELDRQGREAGRAALISTVEALTGLSIDHYAEVNLAGFLELTESLGGVPVCLKEPARDSYSGIDLPAGPQTVSGAQALAFVRQRHGLDGGDLDRIARQQAFLAGLVQRFRENGTFTDPAQLSDIADIVTRYVVLDSQWVLGDLLTQLRSIPLDELTLRTIPTGRPDLETPVDGVAVQVDPATVRAFAHGVVYGTEVAATSTATTPTTTAPTTTPTTTRSAAPTTSRVISADGVPCVN